MNDLAVANQPFSLTPKSLDEAMRFCKLLSQSEIVPKDFVGKEANILVAVQWGMELGLQPLQAMQSIAVINGRPALWGDAVLALVKASPLCEWVREEISADKAVCIVKRRDDPTEHRREFTMADAEKASLKGKAGPWTQYPKRMLQMRARAWCLRDVFPDVLRGVQVAEEQQDVTEREVKGPAEFVEQPRAASDVQPPPAQPNVTAEPTPAAAATPAQPEGTPTPAQDTSQGANGNGTAAKSGPATEGQLRILRAKLKNAALTETDLVAKFGPVEELRADQFNQVQEWITKRAEQIAG